ncbi:hypothetical protein PsYK624_166610 [Phanerochaete sordida]|uniref:Uncharacterized protein n=1 Tax=Phanerochaete sordida TaxID=48140 RepID=A0A9P3GSM0_9APHY|nr:hypothetical protein PsYK624_166610 [Phanerochaete sordida]
MRRAALQPLETILPLPTADQLDGGLLTSTLAAPGHPPRSGQSIRGRSSGCESSRYARPKHEKGVTGQVLLPLIVLRVRPSRRNPHRCLLPLNNRRI